MKTIYLHIGMPKTGTTFLQKSLFDNSDVLKKYGYDYPDMGIEFTNVAKHRNAHFLASPLAYQLEVDKIDTLDSVYEEGLAKIKEIIQKTDNIILSDEMIWVWGGEYLERFKKDMDECNCVIKVIVYLRRQDTFIQSYWSQLVKVAMTKRAFSAFTTDEKTDYYRLHFDKGMEYFANIFGEENMIVRVYEKGQFGGRYSNLLSDFLETVGLGEIDENKEFVFNVSKKNKSDIVNFSLNGIYTHTKRLLNRNPYFCDKSNFSIYRLYEMSLEDDNPKNIAAENLMTYENKLEYLKKFEKGNKAVADKYLGGNGGSLFKAEIVNNDNVYAKYTGVEVIDVCSEFIKREHEDYLAKCEELKDMKSINSALQKEVTMLNNQVKKQQSTIDWLSASLPKKVSRKVKRIFKSNKKKSK
ncbi:MAG: hypothetical protein J1F17_02605 [Oscillospiraceae bacterium]|nr:hypothetical protein [Oscillospiraceae bacterium]